MGTFFSPFLSGNKNTSQFSILIRLAIGFPDVIHNEFNKMEKLLSFSMYQHNMQQLDAEAITQKYNSIEVIWHKEDRWHTWTSEVIVRFVKKVADRINFDGLKILNAGSGGSCYGLEDKDITHVDIAANRIAHLRNAVVASIENIPLPDQHYDVIICVGSVINYCNPEKSIAEFNRLLKKGGILILEFENSNTLELIGTSNFNKKSVLADTFYYGNERIWYFSDRYMQELFSKNGLKIIHRNRFHVFSPLVYRITGNERFSAMWARLDKVFKYLFFNKLASNTILQLKKME